MVNLLLRTDTVNVHGFNTVVNFWLFFNFRKLNQDLVIGLIIQLKKKSPKLKRMTKM